MKSVINRNVVTPAVKEPIKPAIDWQKFGDYFASGIYAGYSFDDLGGTRGTVTEAEGDYTNPVVRVRRSTDSAERSFSAGQVLNGTLVDWVTESSGSADGLVRTFYNQFGSSLDIIQTNTSQQPKIVDSGSLILDDHGNPCMQGDGVDWMSSVDAGWNTVADAAYTMFLRFTRTNEQSKILCSFGNGSADEMDVLMGAGNTAGNYAFRTDQTNYALDSKGTSGVCVMTAINLTGAWIDGVAEDSNTGGLSPVTTDRFTLLARRNGSIPTTAKFNTLVIYDSNKSSARQRIEKYLGV